MGTDSHLHTIHFDEFATNLNTIFDEVASGGDGITVERGGRLFTLKPLRRRTGRKRRYLTPADALWEIVGIGASGEPGNTVASNKYPYVGAAIGSQGTVERTTASPDRAASSAHEGGDQEEAEDARQDGTNRPS